MVGQPDPRLLGRRRTLWRRDHLQRGSAARPGYRRRHLSRAAAPVSRGPFAVVNGDIYTDFPFETLAIDAKYDSHLVLVPNPSYLQGDFGLERGEARAGAAELFTFRMHCGLSHAPSSPIAQDGVFPMKPLWRRSMAAGLCSGQLYTGPWEDVGTPQRLAMPQRGKTSSLERLAQSDARLQRMSLSFMREVAQHESLPRRCASEVRLTIPPSVAVWRSHGRYRRTCVPISAVSAR